MKYTFTCITPQESWDEFIEFFPRTNENVPKTTFIQSSAWKTFQEKTGKETLSFTITNESNQLIGLGLGIVIRAKRGKYLYFRNGPILDWSNEELVSETLSFLKREAQKLGLWFVRLSPLIEKHSQAEQIIQSHNLPLAPMNDVEALDTWLVSLHNKNEEALMSDTKKKVRYEIRKALKNVEFEVYEEPSKIHEFYKILQETVSRKNWNAYSKEYILAEFEAFAQNKNASLILGNNDGKYIAGGIFIHYASQTYYHYAASSSEYKNLSAPYGIIWTAMQEAIKRNHDFFNFWGIVPEHAKASHPWSGLTQFKMKFPGFAQRWVNAHDIPVKPLYWLTNTYERIDKKRKGY